MEENGEFDLYVFSSNTQTWTLKKPVLLLEDDGAADLANYIVYKAVALGGGSVAFVDFWNGILVCDVLDRGERPELHYLPLPTGLCQPSPSCYPLSPCDIAINMSGDTVCIRLAEVVYPLTSSSVVWCTDTWTATTTATSPWRQLKGWHKESTDGAEISVADGVSLAGLLDLDHGDDDDEPRTLGCLFADKPMLSLAQDNLVCFLLSLMKQHFFCRLHLSLDATLCDLGNQMQLSDDFDVNIFRANGACTAQDTYMARVDRKAVLRA